jgi:hypothetical protein
MSRRVVYRTLNFGKGDIPANTPLFKISDTKPYTSGLVLLPDFNELTSSFNSFASSYSTGSFTGSFTGNLIGTASFALNTISGSIQEQLDEKVNITDLGTLSRQEFTYTTGLQEFTIVQTPAAIYNVFVNGQELLSTQYSVATDVLTIIDTLVNGDTISVIYSTVPVNVPPSYTKVETDNLLLGKEDLTNKATNLTSPDNTKYPTTQAVVTELNERIRVLICDDEKVTITGVNVDTAVKTYLIPAGTLTDFARLKIECTGLKQNNTGTGRYNIFGSTSPTFSTLTASELRRINLTGVQYYSPVANFEIRDNTIEGLINNTAINANDEGITVNAPKSAALTFNKNQDYYIHIVFRPNTTTESYSADLVTITAFKEKNTI